MQDILTTQVKLSSSYGKVVCEKSWRWDTTEFPIADFDLWYVWGGEGEVQLNGVTQSVSRGSCFLFRPGDRTLAKLNPLKPLIVTFIHFSFTVKPESNFVSYHPIRNTAVFETFLNRYVTTLLAKDAASEEEARMLLKLSLLQFFRESTQLAARPSVNERMYDAIQNIADRIRQNPGHIHRMLDLAEQDGVSARYLSIKFKETTGQTLESFIILTRIERAEHLLRFTGMNVTEVAEALGYNNIYFFSRQFKTIRGINPSEVSRQTSK